MTSGILAIALALSLAVGGAGTAASAVAQPAIRGHVYLGVAGGAAPAAGAVSVQALLAVPGTNQWAPSGTPVLTDSAGDYALPVAGAGSYRVQFNYIGAGSYMTPTLYRLPLPGEVAVAVSSVDVTGINNIIPATRTLTGQVVLEPGSTAPAAGAVRITPNRGLYPSGTFTPLPQLATLSGAGGAFVLAGLQWGSYTFTYDYLAAGQPYRSYTTTIPVQISEYVADQPLNMSLYPTQTISGRIDLGSSGVAAGPGEVSIAFDRTDVFGVDSFYVTTTGANGEFSMAGLGRGNWNIVLTYSGPDDFPTYTYCPNNCINLTGDMTGVNIVMPAGQGFSGTARGSGGQAVAGATVRAVRVELETRWVLEETTTVTDAAGAYTFTGLEMGDYEVYFEKAGYAVQGWNGLSEFFYPDILTLAAGEQLPGIDATLFTPSTITGSVISSGGVAYTVAEFLNGTVYAYLAVFDHASGAWVNSGYEVNLSSTGAFAFTDLAPDDYRVVAVYYSGGTWQEKSSATVSPRQSQVTTSVLIGRAAAGQDYSGDGLGDVLARDSSGGLWMYRGNGTSGWVGGSKIGTGWNGFNLVFDAGDFDSDGFNDVIGRTPNGDLYLYRGNGAGGWLGGSKIGSGWSGFNAIFGVGDFSGDGNPDVMTRTPSGDLYLYAGNGAGGWAGASKIGSGWNGFDLVFGVGDFSGDGNPDVMARTPAGGLYVYRGNGAGGWASSAMIGSGWNGFGSVFGVGDFSGDGQADVMTKTPGGDLYLYRGDGNSGWAGSAKIGSGWGTLSIVQ